MNISEVITGFFNELTNNDYLTLYIISIIPIIELRGALVIMAGMSSISTPAQITAGMFCCIAGSTTVILPLLLITRPLIKRLKRTKLFSKLARNMESNLADRAESAYSEEKGERRLEKAKEKGKKVRKPLAPDTKKSLGLFVFVAIPLPMTGAWTGSCIGSFLDFPVWKAALSIFAGNIVAGGILTLLGWLVSDYADLFLYGFVVLAIAIAVILYFSRAKRNEQKIEKAKAKYADSNEFELDLLKKEAEEMGHVLIKNEYIDENGDKHIVIGKDENRNSRIVDDDDVI